MAVYLDANVLCKWSRLGLEAAALRLVTVYELRQPLFVPSLALAEAERYHRHRLESLVKERGAADRQIAAYLDDALEPFGLDVAETVARWRNAVMGRMQVLDVTGDDARQGLLRE